MRPPTSGPAGPAARPSAAASRRRTAHHGRPPQAGPRPGAPRSPRPRPLPATTRRDTGRSRRTGRTTDAMAPGAARSTAPREELHP